MKVQCDVLYDILSYKIYYLNNVKLNFTLKIRSRLMENGNLYFLKCIACIAYWCMMQATHRTLKERYFMQWHISNTNSTQV